MKNNELLRSIEALWPKIHDEIIIGPVAPNGERYQVFMGTDGISGAITAFREYIKDRDKNDTLYWRTLPETEGNKWYMRLVIGR